MTDAILQDFARRAREAGLIGAGAEEAQLPEATSRPWPVVLLSALGAWLAVIPFLAFVAMLLPDRGASVAFVLLGLGLVGASTQMLRSRKLPLFVEQLAFPLLLAGLALLGFGLADGYSARHSRLALVLVSLACLACAAWIPRAWLRTVLAALSAFLLATGLLDELPFGLFRGPGIDRSWLIWHLILLPGAVAAALPARRARLQEALDPLVHGWLAATALALALLSGRTFLLGGVPDLEWNAARFVGSTLPAAISALLALAATFVLLRHPPGASWRRAFLPTLAAVTLAAAAPALGAALLIGALALASGRRHLAIAAGLAALWIIGAFYYQLQWTLAAKGLLLLSLGAMLGAAALIWRERPAAAASEARLAAPATPRRWLLLASPLLLLAMAGWSITGNERIIAHGSPLFARLAPVDPRSLMAGDYMALRFELPPGLPSIGEGFDRPSVAFTCDERGMATASRLLAPGETPRAGEVVVKLAPTRGGWTIASDAWHFREGEAERWSKARYGEFRVLPDGRALLVGLRGPRLETL